MKLIKVVLDTNFLVYCAEHKVDYAEGILEIMKEGYELVVPEQVVFELRKLSEKTKKFSDKSAAKLALKILEHNELKVIKAGEKHADESIISLAKNGAIIATLDLALRRKLSRRARVLVIRSKKKIAFG